MTDSLTPEVLAELERLRNDVPVSLYEQVEQGNALMQLLGKHAGSLLAAAKEREQLQAEVERLKAALGRAAIGLRNWYGGAIPSSERDRHLADIQSALNGSNAADQRTR